jgi:hypothetical protein
LRILTISEVAGLLQSVLAEDGLLLKVKKETNKIRHSNIDNIFCFICFFLFSKIRIISLLFRQ